MTEPTCIHHINFIVANLQAGVKKYRRMLGLGEFEYEELPERGASTARILLGETWLVLVSPTRSDSSPGRFLERHGEGFFLLSFGVKDLDAALESYEANGSLAAGSVVRSGLENWRVVDLETENKLGARFHLTETS